MKVWYCLGVLTTVLALAGCDSGPTPNSPLPEGGPVSKDEGPRHEPLPDGPDAQKEFTTTASGLQYRILRKGNGDFPTINDKFVAHYKGWLDNGKEFDTSYDDGVPLTLPVTQVVDGWKEGLQLIDIGGKIELIIPPELGYKDRDMGDIPPNSTLHFIMELVDIQ